MLGDYNAYFEMGALLFITVMLLRYFLSVRFPGRTNRLFGIFLVCMEADVALDILGCLILTYIDRVPVSVNMAVNTLFYVFHAFIPMLALIYVRAVAGKRGTGVLRQVLLMLPAALFFISLAVNLFSPGIVFSIQTGADGHRHYVTGGPMYLLMYISSLFFMLCTAFTVYLRRRELSRSEKICIISFVLICIATVVIQFLLPSYLLTGTAMAISLFIMIFTLENPQAMVDKASGAFNYNALMAYTDEAIRLKKPQHIVICEVDGIGSIDRDFGMMAGNQYVTGVCDFFRSVTESGWVFRVIGARFLLIARGKEDMQRVSAVIEERFSRPWRFRKISCTLSATVLCLETPDHFSSANEFMAFVDEVTAQRGRDGKLHLLDNSYDILSHVRRRQDVEEALRLALREKNGLFLNYQPVYGAETGRMESAEALCRLKSPLLGRIPPDEFIQVAERCGLAPQVDATVIRAACDFLMRHPALKRLEINLSGAEFFHDPTEFILGVLSEFDVDPSRICFEITETASAHHPETVRSFMEAMLGKGYSFALDDFGTGYANISQVMHLPFDLVKLDRSLLEENEKTRMLLSTLLKLFADLGKHTVTEGVETEPQLIFVREGGAAFIQGYYFSKPLSENDFTLLLNGQ